VCFGRLPRAVWKGYNHKSMSVDEFEAWCKKWNAFIVQESNLKE